MTIVGRLPVIVFVLSLLAYLALSGFTKASVAEVCRIAFAVGFLVFLVGASTSFESCSTSSAPSHAR